MRGRPEQSRVGETTPPPAVEAAVVRGEGRLSAIGMPKRTTVGGVEIQGDAAVGEAGAGAGAGAGAVATAGVEARAGAVVSARRCFAVPAATAGAKKRRGEE